MIQGVFFCFVFNEYIMTTIVTQVRLRFHSEAMLSGIYCLRLGRNSKLKFELNFARDGRTNERPLKLQGAELPLQFEWTTF